MANTTESIECYSPAQAEALAREILDPNLDIGQLRQKAERLLTTDNPLRIFEKLTQEDRKNLVNRVDQAFPVFDIQNAELLILFGRICGAIKQLPTSVVLSGDLTKRDDTPVAPGGMMDVWHGEHGGVQVAIKSFRSSSEHTLDEATEIAWRMALVWKKITHPGIVVFRGVNMEIFPLALVYDWRENIVQHVESHPEASRPTLLLEAATALGYLHSLGIPHGNLKGTNVLVDESGHARLADYGTAPMKTHSSLMAVSPTAGNLRWLAPEILNPPHAGVPLESAPVDVFAFGMLAIEVFTGTPPFPGCDGEEVIRRILGGTRPELPRNAEDVGLTTERWQLLEKCWDLNPAKRPTMEEVARRWEDPSEINEDPPEINEDPPEINEDPPEVNEARPTQPDTGRPKKSWKKLLCGLG